MKRFYAFALLTLLLTGCTEDNPPIQTTANSNIHASSSVNDPYGKVFYLDGAGNLGYGQDTVPQGLRRAGFKGSVENVIWTTFTGPLGDQVIRLNARLRSEEVTKKIVHYRKNYSDAPVYVIGLSAGTGVAVWGVENLPDGTMVDTMVLLGSSLSKNYNMTKCLKHVKNKVYVFYSPNDAVLSRFIPVTGTIDGAYLVEPAGLVGMDTVIRGKTSGQTLHHTKIVNIPWRPDFERYGYAGGHTDGTSAAFVRWYIAPNLLGISPHQTAALTTSPTTQP